MSLIRKITKRRERRSMRVRSALKKDMVRVSVFKSLNHIYAQIIDDSKQQTVMSVSSLQLTSVQGDKKAVAFAVGKALGEKALAQGIIEAAFDRGQFVYHGRVKALAEGLRESGMRI